MEFAGRTPASGLEIMACEDVGTQGEFAASSASNNMSSIEQRDRRCFAFTRCLVLHPPSALWIP